MIIPLSNAESLMIKSGFSTAKTLLLVGRVFLSRSPSFLVIETDGILVGSVPCIENKDPASTLSMTITPAAPLSNALLTFTVKTHVPLSINTIAPLYALSLTGSHSIPLENITFAPVILYSVGPNAAGAAAYSSSATLRTTFALLLKKRNNIMIGLSPSTVGKKTALLKAAVSFTSTTTLSPSLPPKPKLSSWKFPLSSVKPY
mmetsp:Transcript_22659/g.38664  ORF Transcript_22659/g.38664 Transcript_22659/m.38664 type:complete len:203 (-) Transcript_22659:1324-1932(-)